jgi:hypothetical protein
MCRRCAALVRSLGVHCVPASGPLSFFNPSLPLLTARSTPATEYQPLGEFEHPRTRQAVATEGGTSDATVHLIEQEVRNLLALALNAAVAAINEHRHQLDRLVDALLERETLERRDLRDLLGPPRSLRPPASMEPVAASAQQQALPASQADNPRASRPSLTQGVLRKQSQ